MIKSTGNRTCPKVITYHENKESLRMKTLKKQEEKFTIMSTVSGEATD